ncbi:thyroid adenoma-associated protein [Spea bombifrons]|uniref:thyroid adenoma-associated protein n=1 Tax=Spea bombifrons TaxID=233779 RepID=UPI002349DC29|nr:thyroid adenoma-associated protein [Spea bombifrons]
MVSKKKKEVKVDSLVLDGFAVEKLKRFVEDKAENVPSLLLHCIQLQDGVQQIHCIKKIVPLLEDLHISSADTDMLYCCLNVLAKMYFSVASKNPLKKALASSLNGLSDRCTAAAAPVFIRCMKEDIESEDLGHYRKAVDNLASCMESFNLGTACVESLFVEILQFLVKVLHTFQSQNKKVLGNGLAQTQLMHDLLTAVKFSMVLVQKVQEPIRTALRADDRSPLWKTMCDLLSCFTEIIMDEDLLQNVQSTSGMAVILYLKTMFEDGEKLPKLVSDVVLGSLDPDAVPGWFMSSCGSRCKDLSDTAMLFLCQGSLAMLGWKNGSMGDSGDKLLLDLLSTLLTLSSRLKESSTAMFLSRTLALWTSSALDVLRSCSSDLKPSLRGSSAACGKLLEYVYIHWEHPLDAIRHQTKVIFKNLLQIHKAAVSEKDEAEDLFLSELTHKLLDLEWHSKGKYASLACLVECVGAEQILAVDQSIPVQILDVMGDQSFAPYASNLLEAMFVNHKNQLMTKNGENSWIDQWHDAWVSPLLLRLCEGEINQTTYIIDYYLPKLLKCSLASLNYMIEILRSSATTNVGSANNRGALGALMACLRTARSHGHIRFTENYVWSGVVSVSLIQQGLVHIHDQVRVDALGLLCESHWTTEVVSLDEMNLVLFFLKYNLNCQSPSVRQQLCYLMRKLFCRIQESSQALCKHEQSKNLKRSAEEKACALDPSAALQQYREFMTSVANYLFESLFPGSSHPTRFSALTILGSIAEIFPVEGSCQAVFALARSVSGNNVRALLECFSNTFEEVKNLAFELLRKLPPSVLGLEDPKKLSILLEAALNLSTSTKHFDCVTASYLLNFLIYQEGLQTALENRIQNRHRPSALPNPKASLVEKNTYSVVRLLMGSLENEILQAERSLLEAAASFPLYGRVHCVSGVLRQLSLKDLSMVAEWRQLISELISMSYRLSEVVSPVVHSSSPEGLMPMDNDTEAATQLHMIMSEIQPRDTNDYFAQPRTLQKENDPLYQLLPEDGVPSDSLCAETKGKDGPSCNVSAQMVLVCCWRSMKEVSLLLGMLCQNLPLQDLSDSACGLVTVEQVKEMGEYFKHHLLQSRHRGAFELAYVGFVKLTEMLIGCTEESLRCLPCQWLCNVLEEIKSSDPSSKLCATRRSAGIPFYIQALLASEPKNSKAGLLKMTMKELIHLALPASDPSGNTSTIPQVHALNILRALFRDTRLGENIIPYVGEGTRAAILGFTSPVWAVRNSSTLLFSTLITRIFGVKRGKDERSKKNRMTGREFFSRFPTLYPFLLEHLEVVANTVDRDTGESKLHPSLFLLLLILSKLYPSPMDGTYSALSMAPFIPFIIRCGHSPVYRSREMASRALVPFCMINDIPQTALELLKSLPDSSNEGVKQNRIHGTLLQVLHLMHSFFEAKHTANSERIKQEVCDLILCLKAKVWLAKRQNPCLITRAAFIDLLTLFINYLGKSKSQDVSGFTDDIADVLEECGLREGACHTHAVPGHVLYMQSVAQLVLSVLSVHVTGGSTDTDRSKTGDLDFPGLIQHMLTSDFHEVRLLSLQSLLQWVTLSPSAASYVHLSLDIEKTLCQMITKETNSECLCQVLKICYELDAKKILLMAKNHFHVEARDFLQLIVELASTRSHSLDIQSSALKLSSKLVIRLVAESQEAPESDLRDWIALLVHSCEVEVQTENKMAAAEVLINTAPYLLLCQRPVLGLSETLNLWKCVVQLLQCEDQDVRDTAADIIRVAQRSSLSGSVFPFCAVNPPKALDLTLCVLCEMLRRWDRVPDGVLVLTEWLLDEDDLSDLQTAKSVEDDFLFEKGEANFWAEKLLYVRLLSTHLRKLISATSCSLPSARLRQLSSGVSEHCDRTERSIEGLPPSPEFLKTSEYTRLLIQKERTSKCMEILSLIQKQMNKDMH